MNIVMIMVVLHKKKEKEVYSKGVYSKGVYSKEVYSNTDLRNIY